MLSVISGNFGAEFVHLMTQSAGLSAMEVEATLRRLRSRGLLQYNDSKETYSFHYLTKQACCVLTTFLSKISKLSSVDKHVLVGIEVKEVTQCFLTAVFRSSIWKAYKMTQSGTCFLAALQVLHNHEAQVYQFMNMASVVVSSDCIVLMEKSLWEFLPCFSTRIDSSCLESKPLE